MQGNCQSRPVTTLLASACPEDDILAPVVTQLQTADDKDSDYQRFEEADVVFAQWVSDTYHVEHLATSTLKSEFGEKIITWPNAFFIGQNPDVVCIATASAPRIIGPLDTYHIRSVYKAWLNNISEEDCLASLVDDSSSHESIADIIQFSLNELKKREAILDVSISDFIEAHWLEMKLFHVFNHPTNALLVEIVNRLCRFAEMKNTVPLLPEFWPEHLDRVIAPGIPSVNHNIDFDFNTSTSSKGFELNYTNESPVGLGSVKIHSLESLVKEFYRAYDDQLIRGEDYTFTPRYLHEDYRTKQAA